MSPRAACSRFAEADALLEFDCGCQIADATTAELYLDAASDLLYQWSGYSIFGVCERTVRPCRSCWCDQCPGCCEIDAIPLRSPVIEIVEIKIDGAVLDASAYRLLPGDRVIRVATGARPPPWPHIQSLWRPDTEPQTFSIRTRFGMESPMPVWVTTAALELACDLAKAATGRRSALPVNTSQVFFQGVAVQMTQDKDAMAKALEALPSVAKFIAVTNPNGYATVASPDGISAWSFPLD